MTNAVIITIQTFVTTTFEGRIFETKVKVAEVKKCDKMKGEDAYEVKIRSHGL